MILSSGKRLKQQDNGDDDDDDSDYDEDFGNYEKDFKVQSQSSTRSQLQTQINKISVGEYKKGRRRDKSQQATVEQVLDPRTRMILYRLLSKGTLQEINGAISTGKEANVYHATARDGSDKAIKIYKTSILIFKDRDRYVSGEFRFRHGYCKSNPRKMVRLWAEKEMRNLMRMYKADIPCPEPILLKNNVLLMGFIGEDGVPAPRLKDANLQESKAREVYLDTILMVRRLYHECKLIHGDLSEFNMLYCKGQAYIIDVSQSVEHDHPHAMEFLRKDITNVTEFFRKLNVPTMTVKELFEFVTDTTITSENIDGYLEQAMRIASNRSLQDLTEQEKIDEEVFKRAFIPRNLDEVVDIERDVTQSKMLQREQVLYHTVTGLRPDLSGPSQVFKRAFIPRNLDEVVDIERDVTQSKTLQREQVLYHTVTGLRPDLSGPSQVPELLERVALEDLTSTEKIDCEEEDSDDDDGGGDGHNDDYVEGGSHSDEEDEEDEQSDRKRGHPTREKNESAEAKKDRKKQVKEAQKERRLTKLPKHIKKRQVKMGTTQKK
ncbi:serine/threonine-protein kinase rio1-like [Plakobranchus ocellatus]|uniref:Serine/threonine-protein kinase RIO1 n=1 Tax=Plakobranchus ocellatus TaxID=259542 RepID=A0AAV3ZRP5_9GAST|nr:serine/threonine-protein kinase rio1-like [Plakobranchus ocellatus]